MQNSDWLFLVYLKLNADQSWMIHFPKCTIWPVINKADFYLSWNFTNVDRESGDYSLASRKKKLIKQIFLIRKQFHLSFALFANFKATFISKRGNTTRIVFLRFSFLFRFDNSWGWIYHFSATTKIYSLPTGHTKMRKTKALREQKRAIPGGGEWKIVKISPPSEYFRKRRRRRPSISNFEP